MILEKTLITIIVLLFIIVLSSLPLYLSIRLMNGKVSILKAFLVMLITGFVSLFINMIFPVFGVLIAWLILIWIFHEVFRLKWFKAVIAWIIWLVFIALFTFLFSLIGISTLYLF